MRLPRCSVLACKLRLARSSLATAFVLACCAAAMADERTSGYPERSPGATAGALPRTSAPGQFQAPDQAQPLDASRAAAEGDRYRQPPGGARTATLEVPRGGGAGQADGAEGERRSLATSGPLTISRPAARKTAGDGKSADRGSSDARISGGGASPLMVIGSLCVVLGLFLLVAWLLRRGMPKASHALPAEVVEVLGRTPLGSRQHAHLLRCGNKLLLVWLSATGAETLTEITDPLEVDRLAGLCRQSQPHSATAAFRHIFQQFGRDRAARGFLDTAEAGRVASLADSVEEAEHQRGEELHA